MNEMMRFPAVVFVLSFSAMWLSAWTGLYLRSTKRKLEESTHKDLDLIVSATLTLLGLIIGFSFSMAISRYDQRKNCEEAEANAISTEYVRAELLPAADAAKVRALLRSYLNERILFYVTRDNEALQQIDAKIAELQTGMWSAVQSPAMAQPNPVSALALSGMNDVLNSQGYTQAAWWNRIPPGAWWLMVAVAICANLLIGYDSRLAVQRIMRLVILPFILCIAFFAIADIDSPRRGVIRVNPQNLIRLAQSLQGE